MVIIAIYVNDIIIATANDKIAQSIKTSLKEWYKVKDLGLINWILGIEVTKNGPNYSMNQTQYIKNMLKRYGAERLTPVKTPMETNKQYSIDMCPKTEAEIKEMAMIPYREAVDSLIYTSTSTCPYISFAVGVVRV